MIPYDIVCGVFDTDRSLLDYTGNPRIIKEEYNSHYRAICPPYHQQDSFCYPQHNFLQLRRIDFYRYKCSDFFTKFAKKINMRHALVSPEKGDKYILGVFRSASAPAFSESEEQILRLLNHSFNRLIVAKENKESLGLSLNHAEYIRMQ